MAPTAREVPEPPDEGAAAAISGLVAECVDRWEEEGPAALEALCHAHPSLASELRSRMSRLGEAGLLGEAGDEGRLPERVAGFRVLSLLGRGAMGVVYLAEQEELQRRVALKLVRPELLWFPGARERFRREVQAVARLAHPGIVPVFAGGEDRSLPWFAMEYVRGATLQDVLDELHGRVPATLTGADLLAAVAAVTQRRAPQAASAAPGEAAARLSAGTWSAACLRVGRAVAEALSHAHAQGVLHRDIKPGNIMLTPEGRVLLVDFGLAAAEGSARLTSSGAQLGSLAWMSPEQLRGERAEVDARSDVYSLGVTLAELLTLRPPFAGSGVEATLARVVAGRSAPLRDLNPALPRDAETVVQTAMDREPARRYATAADFATDLGNVLELRPIAARRPGALLRARRWAQRRPAAATGLALGTLLVVGGPLLYGVMQGRAARVEREFNDQLGAANRDLDDANAQLTARGAELQRSLSEEQAQREAAERSFQAALGAIGHVLRATASEDLEDVPRMQQVRLATIDRALELFPALEHDRPDDPLVLTESASLHLARAEVLRDLGRPQEGLAEFRVALELHRRLAEVEPTPSRRDDLAEAASSAGKALAAMYRTTEALPYYDEALAALRAADALEPEQPARLRQLAVCLTFEGEARHKLSQYEAADDALREALRQLDRAHQVQPADASLQWTEGRVLSDIGDLVRDRGDPTEALDWQERSLAAFRAAHAAEPQHRFYAFDVCSGLHSCAMLERSLRRIDAAQARLAEAQPIIDELLRDYPDSERYRVRRSELLDALALCHGMSGDHARAFELLAEGAKDKQVLVDAKPDRCDLQALLAQSQVNQANSLVQRVTDLPHARELLASALKRLRACQHRDALPVDNGDMVQLALYLSALLECVDGQLDAARPAIAAYAESGAEGADFHRRVADLWNEWVLALRRAEPDATARAANEAVGRAKFLEHLTRAVELGYADVDELRSTKSLDPFRADEDFVALLARVEKGANP